MFRLGDVSRIWYFYTREATIHHPSFTVSCFSCKVQILSFFNVSLNFIYTKIFSSRLRQFPSIFVKYYETRWDEGPFRNFIHLRCKETCWKQGDLPCISVFGRDGTVVAHVLCGHA